MKKHGAECRQQKAAERQENRSKISTQEQIDITKKRRGNSRRELARLRKTLRRDWQRWREIQGHAREWDGGQTT